MLIQIRTQERKWAQSILRNCPERNPIVRIHKPFRPPGFTRIAPSWEPIWESLSAFLDHYADHAPVIKILLLHTKAIAINPDETHLDVGINVGNSPTLIDALGPRNTKRFSYGEFREGTQLLLSKPMPWKVPNSILPSICVRQVIDELSPLRRFL